jgi:hypothetical protein
MLLVVDNRRRKRACILFFVRVFLGLYWAVAWLWGGGGNKLYIAVLPFAKIVTPKTGYSIKLYLQTKTFPHPVVRQGETFQLAVNN